MANDVSKFVNKVQDAGEVKKILNNLNLIDEIMGSEKDLADEQAIGLVDMSYPMQDELKRWMINLLKPFLLSILNEPRYDYSQLLPEEAVAL